MKWDEIRSWEGGSEMDIGFRFQKAYPCMAESHASSAPTHRHNYISAHTTQQQQQQHQQEIDSASKSTGHPKEK
jgi:hypothetical protein